MLKIRGSGINVLGQVDWIWGSLQTQVKIGALEIPVK